MDDIHLEHLISLSQNTRHKKVDGQHFCHANNPKCGDDMTVYCDLDSKGIITSIGYNGYSCALSGASAHVLSEHLTGKHVDEIKNILPSTVYTLLGVNVNPLRSKCVLLPHKALNALYDILKQ